MNGRVVKFKDTPNGGYGFILGDDCNRYFFHRSKCWIHPTERDRVSFEVNITPKGLEAINVDREGDGCLGKAIRSSR